MVLNKKLKQLVYLFLNSAYDHAQNRCLATLRCGKCAGLHLTRLCHSTFLECAVYSGAHASYHRRCRIRQAEQKKLDDCHSLRDSFYPATEDLEPKTKLEAPQDSSSAAGPMVLVDMSPAQGNRSQHQAVPRPSSSRAEYSQTCR